MPSTFLSGKSLRLARLSRYGDSRYLFVPLDHSVSDGPVTSAAGFTRLVSQIALGGADGVVLHKGRTRMLPADALHDCALVVHLSASTAYAPDVNAKVLVGDVQEAVRVGADAVSVHVNIGSDSEREQLADLGRVAGACDQWGIPLLAMVYPRGPRIDDPTLPGLLAHVVNIAADLGVDVVKTVMAAPAERMSEVVASSPLPIVVAGGGSTERLDQFARTAITAGCAGLAVGRRVFLAADPRREVTRLAAIVHDAAAHMNASSLPEMAGAL